MTSCFVHYFLRFSVGYLIAEVEANYPGRHVQQHLHIVLYQYHGNTLLADLFDLINDEHGLFMIHAGGRLIEKEHAGDWLS